MLKRSAIYSICIALLSFPLTACAELPSWDRPLQAENPHAGMRLMVDEEFNDKKLNTDFFALGMPWDAPNNADNGNLNAYLDSAVEVSNGVLHLWAKKPSGGVRYKNGQRFAYSSGMAHMGHSYSFQYGYVEARMKMPPGKGMWGAFWLLPASPLGKWPPEIDALEHHGDKPNTAFLSLHYKDANGEIQHDIHEVTVPSMTDDFHTYGVLWQPERIVWYIDGQRLAESTEGIPAEQMYILLNLAVGGTWPGSPDESTQFPAQMEVDYLRVWQH